MSTRARPLPIAKDIALEAYHCTRDQLERLISERKLSHLVIRESDGGFYEALDENEVRVLFPRNMSFRARSTERAKGRRHSLRVAVVAAVIGSMTPAELSSVTPVPRSEIKSSTASETSQRADKPAGPGDRGASGGRLSIGERELTSDKIYRLTDAPVLMSLFAVDEDDLLACLTPTCGADEAANVISGKEFSRTTFAHLSAYLREKEMGLGARTASSVSSDSKAKDFEQWKFSRLRSEIEVAASNAEADRHQIAIKNFEHMRLNGISSDAVAELEKKEAQRHKSWSFAKMDAASAIDLLFRGGYVEQTKSG